ncbi:MAG: YkgJ family cysteine cluster protein [Desulfobulbaceae bacterium]|nr:YkgJ family cysteine cluster protein [Desulfobulbaceae bacterium]
MSNTQTHCRQCGTCCKRGGPALHHQDTDLLREGVIGYRHLVTIREGEFAYSPASGALETVDRELVKINGQGGEWTCLFFEKGSSSCGIYGQRPLECRLLKCWEPDELLSVAGRDTICRRDIVNAGDPVVDLIAHQQRECPAESVALAVESWRQQPENDKGRDVLADLVRRDLALRNHAIVDLGLPAEVEFFVFGRPLFKQLAGFGVALREVDGHLEFLWP